jgi:integrase
MSVVWDNRNKRWRFFFNRVIAGRRHRASRLLPRGWSQAQADAFDRQEGARLYAVGTGIERADALIDVAVAHYLTDKRHLKSYQGAVEHLGAIHWAYTGKPLSELPAIAAEVVEQADGLSNATIKNRLALLKAACRWAWKKHNVCDHDPTTRMQLPTVRNERHVYIGRAEMLRICRACRDHSTRIAIRVAFYSGMRLGEIQRAEPGPGYLVLADTKNDDRRAVPIHPRIRTCIDYLPLDVKDRQIQHAFAKARRRVKMGHVHFHDLRHSAASEMVNAGVGLYEVGAVLGHRDPRSTKRYAHLTAGTLSAAVNRIGRGK